MAARVYSASLIIIALMTASCATSVRLPRVEEMTLDEKIGQMIVPGAHGVFMNATSPAWQRLERRVRQEQVGGLIWFVSNVYETAELNRRLQAAAKIPLLISADLEAGVGMRFQDTTYWPTAMAVAATGDPSLAEREGRAVAIEARAIGINQIFAPVADVNVDPDNPVINARSFGEDPQTVARFVTAFIRGVQSEGVLATAKHFPGHGDTHVDSHRSLPVLNVTRERLEAIELVPFRAAVAAGVDSVMVGHLSVPSLDPTPAPPRLDSHDGIGRGIVIRAAPEDIHPDQAFLRGALVTRQRLIHRETQEIRKLDGAPELAARQDPFELVFDRFAVHSHGSAHPKPFRSQTVLPRFGRNVTNFYGDYSN